MTPCAWAAALSDSLCMTHLVVSPKITGFASLIVQLHRSIQTCTSSVSHWKVGYGDEGLVGLQEGGHEHFCFSPTNISILFTNNNVIMPSRAVRFLDKNLP